MTNSVSRRSPGSRTDRDAEPDFQDHQGYDPSGKNQYKDRNESLVSDWTMSHRRRLNLEEALHNGSGELEIRAAKFPESAASDDLRSMNKITLSRTVPLGDRFSFVNDYNGWNLDGIWLEV